MLYECMNNTFGITKSLSRNVFNGPINFSNDLLIYMSLSLAIFAIFLYAISVGSVREILGYIYTANYIQFNLQIIMHILYVSSLLFLCCSNANFEQDRQIIKTIFHTYLYNVIYGKDIDVFLIDVNGHFWFANWNEQHRQF